MSARNAIVILLVFLLAAGASAQPVVSGLRLGENAERTRFVIDVDRALEPEIFTLADPYRLVIDLPAASFTVDGQGAGEGRGLVTGFRYGLFSPEISRIVLDLEGAAALERFFALPPQGPHRHRLVFDLKPVSREAFLASLRTPKRVRASNPAAVADATASRQRQNGRRVVVIDAGHGGNDPGAPGVTGAPEKAVTLAVAKEAARQLEASGRYRVVLTRDRDIYLRLRDRVEIARRNKAELFISLHADSLRDRRVRGATVYTLSENASDAEAAALAARENKADLLAGIDLGEAEPEVATILIDLARRETMNYSAHFANYLIPELDRRVVLRRNSHRFAGFVVLKAPDVPSVLVEMGYMSNRQDSALLTSRDGQQRIGAALLAAVDHYFAGVQQARY